MSALVVVSLAAALVAVRSVVLTGEAVHDVEVVGAECTRAITVLRKIAGVDRLSARCPSNLDLKQHTP